MPDRRRKPPFVYALGLAAFAAAGLLAWPIVAYDTDLFYHLAGGRFILEHLAVPRTSYFSFLSPPRFFEDYYWLFQVGVQWVHSLAGFPGLIALRAGLFGLCLWFVFSLLMPPQRRGSWYAGALVSLYIVALLPRFNMVRPHMVVYVLIVFFLFILERRPDLAWVLPPAAALWGNLHGASYPVLLLIASAYVLEHFSRLRGKERAAPLTTAGQAGAGSRQRLLAYLGLASAAVFLTPYGADLVDVPFIPIGYANLAITEYAPIHLRDIGTFFISDWALSPETASNLLLGLTALSAAAALCRGRARASHLALAAGGAFLLTKGLRFRYECALLVLPLLACEPPLEPWPAGLRPARWPVLALAALPFLLAPFFAVTRSLGPRERYPLSRGRLPAGVASFLSRNGTGGTILSHPNFGGYLQWALYPRYRIAIDMQCTIWFADRSFYDVTNAFDDGRFMRELVSRYHPDFVMASLQQTLFPEVLRRFPDYVPVFFDDAAALYVDRGRHPELAREYALPVDPFNQPEPPDRGPEAARKAVSAPPYLEHMIAMDPECLTTRMDAGRYCLLRKDFRGALSHAEAVIRAWPSVHHGYLLKGRALAGLGSWEDALGAFKTAAAKSKGADPDVFRAMAKLYVSRGRKKDALWALRQTKDGKLPPEIW